MRLAALFLTILPALAQAQQPPQPPKPTAVTHAAPTDHTTAVRPANPDKKPDSQKPAAPKATQPKTILKPPRRLPPPATHPATHPAPAPAPTPAPAEPPAEPNKGSKTGLPLPRYAALRSDDVNFRSGPGKRYPIEWVYKRRDLPVLIEREFDVYFLVKDPFGNKGWVSQATLTGRRTAVVAGSERVLRQAASDTAAPIAKLQPGVILRLRSCDAGSEWCQAQIADYRGFVRRNEIWGVAPDEVIQ